MPSKFRIYAPQLKKQLAEFRLERDESVGSIGPIGHSLTCNPNENRAPNEERRSQIEEVRCGAGVCGDAVTTEIVKLRIIRLEQRSGVSNAQRNAPKAHIAIPHERDTWEGNRCSPACAVKTGPVSTRSTIQDTKRRKRVGIQNKKSIGARVQKSAHTAASARTGGVRIGDIIKRRCGKASACVHGEKRRITEAIVGLRSDSEIHRAQDRRRTCCADRR